MDVSREEMQFKWFQAAKLYEETAKSNLARGSSTAGLWEKIGYCYDLASRQAKNTDEFKTLRQLGVRAYKKAADIYIEGNKTENVGKSENCLANAEYARSWIAVDASEKAKILGKSRDLAKKAMQAFRNSGNDKCFGQTANLLTACLYDLLYVTSNVKEKNEIAKQGMSNANESVSVLSKIGDKDNLAIAYSLASIQAWYVALICENEEDRKSVADKSVSYAESALMLSKELNNPYLKAMSLWASVWSNVQFTENLEISLKYATEMLEQSIIVHDNYLKGVALYLLADVSDMTVHCEPNPDKRRHKYEEVIRYSEESIRNLDLVFQDELIAETYLLPAQTYSILASDFAETLSEKIIYSKKAMEIGKKGLEYAKLAGSPEAMISALHGLSKAYYYHSFLEPRKENKSEFLRQALVYRKEYVNIANESFSSNSWVLGISKVYLGQIETDLSRLERDEKSKVTLLKDAIIDMEDGVLHCKDWKIFEGVPTFIATVAKFEDNLGGALYEGYLLTTENTNLSRANEVYLGAVEDFKKLRFVCSKFRECLCFLQRGCSKDMPV